MCQRKAAFLISTLRCSRRRWSNLLYFKISLENSVQHRLVVTIHANLVRTSSAIEPCVSLILNFMTRRGTSSCILGRRCPLNTWQTALADLFTLVQAPSCFSAHRSVIRACGNRASSASPACPQSPPCGCVDAATALSHVLQLLKIHEVHSQMLRLKSGRVLSHPPPTSSTSELRVQHRARLSRAKVSQSIGVQTSQERKWIPETLTLTAIGTKFVFPSAESHHAGKTSSSRRHKLTLLPAVHSPAVLLALPLLLGF